MGEVNYLKNQYKADNIFGIPIVRKCNIKNKNLKFICFDQIGTKKRNSPDKSIHFFTDDSKFNKVYNKPKKYAMRLAKFDVVLTPDFSLYTDMPVAVQLHNVFKNRWCGSYWQDLGFKRVVPTISWSNEKSYEFCFLGVEQGSIVAVSTLGTRKRKDLFIKGYKTMMEIISPSLIYCYSEPFKEMDGNIICVEYMSKGGLY